MPTSKAVAQGSNPSPFHEGERAVQDRAGVRQVMDRVGRAAIRDFMPDQHRLLFEELPYLVAGGWDRDENLWASMLFGWPGFVRSPDSQTLRVDALPLTGDPLGGNLSPGRQIGLLGIQLETRRRNRVNGTVLETDPSGFTVRVEQSFGNCPQYIWARKPFFARDPHAPVPAARVRSETNSVSLEAVALAQRSDTFFIASAAKAAERPHGVDVSHRGGKPGFVRVAETPSGTVMTFPDFSGNRYFNTLGNLHVNPSAGLLFAEFRHGSILSLTGEAQIIWDGPELESFAGAERLVRFSVKRGVLIEDALPCRWSAAVPAPQLADTGSWG